MFLIYIETHNGMEIIYTPNLTVFFVCFFS